MNVLVLAFYGEGPTDERYLPIVIQRTAEKLLLERSHSEVEVLSPINLREEVKRVALPKQAERILKAARLAYGYHALIIHADADAPTPEAAVEERLTPGFTLAKASPDVCGHLIPIVPVRMTEAWMLSDPIALKQVIGTGKSDWELGLPAHPHQVETELDPKSKLVEVIKLALGGSPHRRSPKLSDIYEPLARQISLEYLAKVPAYKTFVADLSTALIALNLIR